MKYKYEVWLEAEAPLVLDSDLTTEELVKLLRKLEARGDYIYDNDTIVPVRRLVALRKLTARETRKLDERRAGDDEQRCAIARAQADAQRRS